jgi:8-oxo-dGTP pyrophosphatase MutT (NUDIX family)
MTKSIAVRPAATLVLIREAESHIQTLLLRRSASVAFAGGTWVFPGGVIDPDDFSDGDKGDVEEAARRAAVRETREETGLEVNETALRYFAHWTTPPNVPRRYAAWFFVAPATVDRPVTVDGGEIDRHIWITPDQALARHRHGHIQLMPPSFITLLQIQTCSTAGEAIASLSSFGPTVYKSRYVSVPGGKCDLYKGDAGYQHSDPNRIGARHRLWMLGNNWTYEKIPVKDAIQVSRSS